MMKSCLLSQREEPSSSSPPSFPILFRDLIKIPLKSSDVVDIYDQAGAQDANDPENNPVSNWDKPKEEFLSHQLSAKFTN